MSIVFVPIRKMCNLLNIYSSNCKLPFALEESFCTFDAHMEGKADNLYIKIAYLLHMELQQSKNKMLANV